MFLLCKYNGSVDPDVRNTYLIILKISYKGHNSNNGLLLQKVIHPDCNLNYERKQFVNAIWIPRKWPGNY